MWKDSVNNFINLSNNYLDNCLLSITTYMRMGARHGNFSCESSITLTLLLCLACLEKQLENGMCNNNKHWIYESRCFPSITILARITILSEHSLIYKLPFKQQTLSCLASIIQRQTTWSPSIFILSPLHHHQRSMFLKDVHLQKEALKKDVLLIMSRSRTSSFHIVAHCILHFGLISVSCHSISVALHV